MVEFDIHSDNKIHFIERAARRKEYLPTERRFFTKVKTCESCNGNDRCSNCQFVVFTTDEERKIITVYIDGESILEADVPAHKSPAHGIVVRKLELLVDGYFLNEELTGQPIQIHLESNYGQKA